jgi:hypothetical protein
MNRLSNLPPGVTDGMIEEHATGYDDGPIERSPEEIHALLIMDSKSEIHALKINEDFTLPGSVDAEGFDETLIRGLASKRCICGGHKGRNMTHCRIDYYKLPPETRTALYKRIGEGYAEAFLASVAILMAAGRTNADLINETFDIWNS